MMTDSVIEILLQHVSLSYYIIPSIFHKSKEIDCNIAECTLLQIGDLFSRVVTLTLVYQSKEFRISSVF